MKRSFFYFISFIVLLGLQEVIAQGSQMEYPFENLFAELISEQMDGILEAVDEEELQGTLVHIESYHTKNSVARTVNRIVRSYGDVEYMQRMTLNEGGETISGLVAISSEDNNKVLLYVGFNKELGGVIVINLKRTKE